MALDLQLAGENNTAENSNSLETVELVTWDIGKRVEKFLTIIDTPDTDSYRSIEALTVFDLREIEKLFQDWIIAVSYWSLCMTQEDFQEIKWKFQKHRFEYAKTLWFGSNKYWINWLKSKFALSEMTESNRIHKELLWEELIDDIDLKNMESQINY